MEESNYIISLFGGKVNLINLLMLIGVFSILSVKIKNNKLRYFSSALFTLTTALQLSSLYFVKSFIGYPFIIHFNVRDISTMFHIYTIQLIYLLIFSVSLYFLFYYSNIILQRKVAFLRKFSAFKSFDNQKTNKVLNYLIVLLIVMMSTNRGVLNVTYIFIKTLKVDDRSFKENLEALNMGDYIVPNKIEISESPKKNIIIISLESYERGYLSDSFAHLTPFLRSLINDENWSYFNMEQNRGSSWTSGSLYTYLTGFPAYFGTQHNSIFQSSYSSNITGISHIMKKAGYQMCYLTPDTKFSGTLDMLYAMQINNIIDQVVLQYEPKDKDIFEKAKEEIGNNESSQPFTLFISTLSTHIPNGIYDQRMEKLVPPQKNNLEFMVAAVDYMLKDFIGFLQEKNRLANTAIYIFPDHLKMGNSRMFKGSGERGLYLITNANNRDISYSTNDTILQIDLPKIILEGAQIKHNVKFLTDYVKGNKEEYIEKNIRKITALNISGFSRTELYPILVPELSEKYNDYRKDTARFIAHAGGMIDGYTYTNSLEALNLNYQNGFRLFELDIRKTNDGKFVAVHDWDEWREQNMYPEEKLPNHDEFINRPINGELTPLDMEKINRWFLQHKDAVLVTDKINNPVEFSNAFIDKKRLKMELFTLDSLKAGINSGILSAMPSQNIIDDLGEDAPEILETLNVKEVAMTRNVISTSLPLLKSLKEKNIKVYVYHVNQDIDKDEEYMVKYEMDYIFGIYADKWSFK